MSAEREEIEAGIKELEKAKREAKDVDAVAFVSKAREILVELKRLRALPEDSKLNDYQIGSYCWCQYALASKSTDAEEAKLALERLLVVFARVKDSSSFWGSDRGRAFGRALFSALVLVMYKIVKRMNEPSSISFLRRVSPAYLGILSSRAPAFLDDKAFEKDPVTDAQRQAMERNNHGKKIRMKSWPSLAEKAFGLMNRCFKARPESKISQEAVDFLLRNKDKGEWLCFYCANAMLQVNRYDEARKLMLEVVRAKRNDSWAWADLARTFKPQPEKAISCLCKALLRPSHDPEISLGMTVKIRRELSSALRQVGKEAEGIREIALADQKAPVDLNDPLYLEWARKADEFLLAPTAKRFSGKLIKRADQAFGFVRDKVVGDVFIPPEFVKKAAHGDDLSGWADLRENKKKKCKSYCMISGL